MPLYSYLRPFLRLNVQRVLAAHFFGSSPHTIKIGSADELKKRKDKTMRVVSEARGISVARVSRSSRLRGKWFSFIVEEQP